MGQCAPMDMTLLRLRKRQAVKATRIAKAARHMRLQRAVAGDNIGMTEQLWAIGGVVAGIVASGGMNLISDGAKQKLGDRAGIRARNRNRCQELLASIELEMAGAQSYEEQHGVMPSDDGYSPSDATARAQLTEVELHCPQRIRKAAVELINQLEAYIWNGGRLEDYRAARTAFISAFRRL